MDDDRTLPFGFPAVRRKKLTAAFDGGRLTSDGGVMLLAAAERELGLCDRLAALIFGPRDPSRVTLTLLEGETPLKAGHFSVEILGHFSAKSTRWLKG